jgi:hypothetical protein
MVRVLVRERFQVPAVHKGSCGTGSSCPGNGRPSTSRLVGPRSHCHCLVNLLETLMLSGARLGRIRMRGLVGIRAATLPATLVGKALAGLFFAIGKARTSSRRALHPEGELRRGLLVRQGCGWSTGVSWLDDAGTDEVLLRFSRSVGLPTVLPDVLGLAVRVSLQGGGQADLLLASTGAGRWGRFLLRLARRRATFYSSLIPYQAPTGPLLVAASPCNDDGFDFELLCARARGRWSSFGRLSVLPAMERGHDTSTAFDPVLNVVPGLNSYRWAAELRRFAYAASRRARAAPLPMT